MRALAIALVLALAGCASRALVPVTYDRAVSRTSEKSGSLHVTPGRTETDDPTSPAAKIPLNPAIFFDLDDQRVFAESLQGELNRLRLLRVANVSWQSVEPADVTVELVFQRIVIFPPAVRYYLDVGLRLQSGERSFSRRYHVFSAQGESAWTNLNTDAGKGKLLAAQKLMARLIPDIERFVAELD